MARNKTLLIVIFPFVPELPEIMYLPVTPSIITVDNPQGVRKDLIVNVGEVADIGPRKPNMVSFSSFFPQYQDTYTNITPFIPPEPPIVWVKRFELLKDSFFRLVITGFNINDLYILDNNFSYKMVGGVGDDIEYSVKFIRHQPLAIRNVNINEEFALEVGNIRNVFSSRNNEERYTVKINDTWSSIANKHNTSPNDLRSYNNKINIFDLVVGDIVFIPPIVLSFSVGNPLFDLA